MCFRVKTLFIVQLALSLSYTKYKTNTPSSMEQRCYEVHICRICNLLGLGIGMNLLAFYREKSLKREFSGVLIKNYVHVFGIKDLGQFEQVIQITALLASSSIISLYEFIGGANTSYQQSCKFSDTMNKLSLSNVVNVLREC